MKKTGLADSPFFSSAQHPKKTGRKSTVVLLSSEEKRDKPRKKENPSGETVQPGNHDTKQPRHHDTMVSRYDDAIVENIRKAVKEFGKEAATHRFTQEEKKAIADIVYTYKNKGVRTSENEIARIAVNFIVSDFKENGKNSIQGKQKNIK